jgi:hypothetical protein
MKPDRPALPSPSIPADVEKRATDFFANPVSDASSASVQGWPDMRPRWEEIQQGMKHPDDPTILSEEGSREVLDEIANGSPLTPERRATFERMRAMAGVRKRKPGRP